jgi:hypothetical protein
MGWTDRHDRIAVALLATLAFLVQLAAPQGFMLASANGAPSIVICTGHGPLLAPGDDHGLPDKGRTQTGACAFAGHGGAPTTPPLLAFAPVRFEHAAAAAVSGSAVAPGRGLAAPPPPSQAPPALIA